MQTKEAWEVKEKVNMLIRGLSELGQRQQKNRETED